MHSGGFGCTTPRNGTKLCTCGLLFLQVEKMVLIPPCGGLEVRNSHKWHKVTNIFDFGAQHTESGPRLRTRVLESVHLTNKLKSCANVDNEAQHLRMVRSPSSGGFEAQLLQMR